MYGDVIVSKQGFITGNFRDDFHSQSLDWCKAHPQTKYNYTVSQEMHQY